MCMSVYVHVCKLLHTCPNFQGSSLNEIGISSVIVIHRFHVLSDISHIFRDYFPTKYINIYVLWLKSLVSKSSRTFCVAPRIFLPTDKNV